MKKLILTTILLVSLIIMPARAYSQGMMGRTTSSPVGTVSDNQTAQEEAEGKEIWEKLQAKQLECKNLTDDNFETLGEYFMGKMAGNSHEAMNNMMKQMMGDKGEEQMHIVMGKRISGCDTSASGVGIMPMMGMMRMMGGGGNPMMGSWNMMGGGWGGFGVLSWLSMLFFWILLILGVIALIRYLARTGQNKDERTPLNILKERYARGEIDKKEFEEKKKDLT